MAPYSVHTFPLCFVAGRSFYIDIPQDLHGTYRVVRTVWRIETAAAVRRLDARIGPLQSLWTTPRSGKRLARRSARAAGR